MEASKENYENKVPGLSDVQDQTIVVACDELNKPFKVIKCKNAQIELRGVTEILFLKELENCTIRAGPTKSAVFVDHCKNCVLEIACHQLRIHNTTDT